MENYTDCWLCKDVEKYFSCTITGGLCIAGVTKCRRIITDEDVLLAQREKCGCCTGDCRRCPESVIFDHNLHGAVAFDSAEERAEATRKEAETIDCFHVKVQRISNTWVISGQSMDGSQFERPATAREVRSLSKLGLINVTAQPGTKAATDEDTKAARKEVGTECPMFKVALDAFKKHVDCYIAEWEVLSKMYSRLANEFCYRENSTKESSGADKLTCANCSFVSESDVRAFPAGISTSIPLPGGVFYCPERDTRVPGTLEGCELHSELRDKQKDKDIAEGFKSMEKLIIEANLAGTTPDESANEESLIVKRIRVERDALKVCNKKLNKDNEALRDKVSFLKANSKVITRYVELQDKNLEKKYEEFGLAVDKYSSLVDKYSHLTDERNELKEKVNSLEKELKTANLDRVATEQANSQICMEFDMVNQDLVAHKCLSMDLESKLARVKEELFGKWRLLEVGEAFKDDDEIYLYSCILNDGNWYPVSILTATGRSKAKTKKMPIRRKITI